MPGTGRYRYGRDKGDEPPNRASEFVTSRVEGSLNDRDFMVRSGLSLCAESFVRYDRRRVAPQPPTDRNGWIETTFTFEELAGEWPTFERESVLAVRGDRLTVERWRLGLGKVGELGFVIVTLVDEAIERLETLYFFESDDVASALAELDRLHAPLADAD